MFIRNINEMPRCPMMILQEIYEKSKYFNYVPFVHALAKYACTLGAGRHIWPGSAPVLLDDG
jgi:hypothetical protein